MRERALGILSRESDRVSHILTNFLEFARPQGIRILPLFLPPLIEELRASWETDPRTEGIPLRWGTIPDLWILADPQCFHQVITNLLSNARKAVRSKGGGEVRVQGEVRGMQLLLVVEDTGCGMTPEQLEHLFVPFVSDFTEGTGLGMSLVYQFIQQMAWDIHVESAEGSGTRIHLRIPIAP
jgi:signal transduction histidine kinase